MTHTLAVKRRTYVHTRPAIHTPCTFCPVSLHTLLPPSPVPGPLISAPITVLMWWTLENNLCAACQRASVVGLHVGNHQISSDRTNNDLALALWRSAAIYGRGRRMACFSRHPIPPCGKFKNRWNTHSQAGTAKTLHPCRTQ